ncbi:flavonol 4'-sulfotransferase-like [Canna indica]|uniref:Sulfotransferase n=1 Tax=Canna indica TaxID=4628 RepID=A0AAQ3JZ82_9LILI|nr:flavonol 4'-sulfotransferase-like [Canna indica]WOK98890.1 flavonol 4'-sulfotransferase-like [Canna indica]WOK98892.1 flavonol 4'-sulfotransferase-like [Canna indica]
MASQLAEPLEEAFDCFCKGLNIYGPYWEHVLSYWKAHVERPQHVLFLKYEELKAEPVAQLKRLAEFLGCPFSEGEEKEGVIEDIVRLCSIENLANLEVNKIGTVDFNVATVKGCNFFRRGVVGDWKNHLTPEMVDQLEKITEQKFQGSGLSF